MAGFNALPPIEGRDTILFESSTKVSPGVLPEKPFTFARHGFLITTYRGKNFDPRSPFIKEVSLDKHEHTSPIQKDSEIIFHAGVTGTGNIVLCATIGMEEYEDIRTQWLGEISYCANNNLAIVGADITKTKWNGPTQDSVDQIKHPFSLTALVVTGVATSVSDGRGPISVTSFGFSMAPHSNHHLRAGRLVDQSGRSNVESLGVLSRKSQNGKLLSSFSSMGVVIGNPYASVITMGHGETLLKEQVSKIVLSRAKIGAAVSPELKRTMEGQQTSTFIALIRHTKASLYS